MWAVGRASPLCSSHVTYLSINFFCLSAHGVELSSRSASARVSGVASAFAIRSFVLSSVSSFEGGSLPDVPKIETLRPVPPRCIVLAVARVRVRERRDTLVIRTVDAKKVRGREEPRELH